jgi:hypothetical protein
LSWVRRESILGFWEYDFRVENKIMQRDKMFKKFLI